MSTDATSPSLSVANAMAEVARTMNAPKTVDEVLQLIVHAATDMIPGINHASVTVPAKNGGCETKVATDELPNRADRIQYELGEGPCIDALGSRDYVQANELPDDERWPRYTRRAAEIGVRSQIAFPLRSNERALGALNLYSSKTGTLERDTRAVAEMFAAHATLALGKAREGETLNAALSTRKMIGQAIGIIQERHGMDEERAFQFLVRVSQTGNIKLRDVAAELVKQANERPSAQG